MAPAPEPKTDKQVAEIEYIVANLNLEGTTTGIKSMLKFTADNEGSDGMLRENPKWASATQAKKKGGGGMVQ